MTKTKKTLNLTEKLLNDFKQINPSVEIINFELGDSAEPVSGLDNFWLKITTQHHGWLHLYINKYTNHLEWY